MLSKLEVGMYVRVKGKNNFPGGIAKVLKLEKVKKDTWLTLDKALDYSFLTSMTNIIKASYNIMDLIEEEDLVVIEYYVSKYRKRISRIFEVTKYENKLYFDNCHCNWSYDLLNHEFIQAKGYNPKIKSIVTKEQFESMKYEVK